MKTAGLKRLTIDLPSDDHFKLKVLASYEGLSMKDYLLTRALGDHKEGVKMGKDDETHYLLKSRVNRARIMKAFSSKKSAKTFSSVRELKHALGI